MLDARYEEDRTMSSKVITNSIFEIWALLRCCEISFDQKGYEIQNPKMCLIDI